ncbi:MAG: UDP-N-acetylglucosamine 4,6-dehydratase (inverting) [Dehalococcoidia bacterium]|nr:UDP-N-acetylglucosamine 4,6-dehydratase (inverting) [Dehalococcoidia bacterium]
MTHLLDGKSILISGGTGSFGQKFIEMAMANSKPDRLIIYSRDELKQHDMRSRFTDEGDSVVRYFIGDVRDRRRLTRACKGVDIVIHAAALKQVPACEYNPIEAVRTNIGGAVNVIDAALDCGVKQVIALSTDKATSPTNLYGATKLVAEKLFVQANSYRGAGGTRFSCVRYGNVLGSRGSILPVWQAQAKRGLITITSLEMTRFLITLPQAVGFVLSSLAMMHGGEIFVPKLPSVTIGTMADAIAPGAEREIIGIRAGEKLHEQMVSVDESIRTVDLGDRLAILPAHPWWPQHCYPEAQPVPAGWSYDSGTNDWWLTAKEVERLIEGTNEENH